MEGRGGLAPNGRPKGYERLGPGQFLHAMARDAGVEPPLRTAEPGRAEPAKATDKKERPLGRLAAWLDGLGGKDDGPDGPEY